MKRLCALPKPLFLSFPKLSFLTEMCSQLRGGSESMLVLHIKVCSAQVSLLCGVP